MFIFFSIPHLVLHMAKNWVASLSKQVNVKPTTSIHSSWIKNHIITLSKTYIVG